MHYNYKFFLKNLPGWHTSRKIVVFAVDDYGNVRMDSADALKQLEKQGIESKNRFDSYDSMETDDDLNALYDILRSVKDKNGHPAVFTPYALCCNMDFEAMKADHYQQYISERLDHTLYKLYQRHPAAYKNTWVLWQQGISEGIFMPQFHGREHFNLNIIHQKLKQRDNTLLAILDTRSLASLPNDTHSQKSWTAAFSFDNIEETFIFPDILSAGTQVFKDLFGYTSICFTPPAQHFPEWMEPTLPQYGVKCIDKAFYKKMHTAHGKYKTQINYTGKNLAEGLKVMIRNAVFEPTYGHSDHVGNTLRQIETAFLLRKPAVISSHRVNFCGHIDEENRKTGLSALSQLLRQILSKWPDVEFMSASQLVQSMIEKQ